MVTTYIGWGWPNTHPPGIVPTTSLYPLHVCGISLTRFKEFRTFWPSSFVDLFVKGTDNFWKFRGIIEGFIKICSQIASGVEKRQMSQCVPCAFVPPLK